MKRFAEQLNKKSKSIKLSAVERRELRERLTAYMEYHPLPASMRQTEQKAPALQSEPFVAINFNMTYLRAAFSSVAMLVVIAVPFLAERSLPGDVLYPVKVQFNEEVRSSLSLSSYAKVEWETERLERRIAEARLLASEGKLTQETEAVVALAVKEHSDKAQKEIATLRESDEDEAAIAEIAFASALAVQSEVLEGHIENDQAETGEGRSVQALVGAVAEAQKVAEASQTDANPTYEKLLARVEMETTRAYELFESIEEYASATEVSDIERRLNDIERKVNSAIAIHDSLNLNIETEEVEETAPEVVYESAKSSTSEEEIAEAADATEAVSEEGIDKASSSVTTETEVVEEVMIKDDKEARELLKAALADTRKLISFMTDIDVRETVSIEELLPMTLTDDEKINRINEGLRVAKLQKNELDERIVPEFTYEKYVFGYETLNKLLIAVETARTEAEYDGALEKLVEVEVVVNDLMAMTKAVPIVAEEIASSTEEVTEETGTSTEATGEVEGVATSSEETVE